MLGEVLDFACPGVAAPQSRVTLASAGPVFRRFSQYFGFAGPNVEVGRHLADEGFTTLVESVEELPVAAVEFVERPGLDSNAV